MDIKVTLDANGILRVQAAIEALAGPRRQAALRRAVNKLGDKCFTQVKRTLAKQMNVPQKTLTANGRVLVKQRAFGASLEYRIVTRGAALRGPELPHTITTGRGGGITLQLWQRRRFFRSAFAIRKGAAWASGSLKNDGFYYRTTKARFPLHALRGPNINKELVKDLTAQAFKSIVQADLPARVEHEVRVITEGVVT